MAPGVTMGSATRYPVLPGLPTSGVEEYVALSDTATAYGWGHLPLAPLRNFTLPFIASSTCRAKFLELNGTYSTAVDFLTPRVVCVGDGTGSTNVPCQGHTDVGTPLLQPGLNGAASVLVGVWSRHTPSPLISATAAAGLTESSTCSSKGKYHVYTRISYYSAWLVDVMATKSSGTCASATVMAANGTLAHIPAATAGLPTVPIGIRYSWGDCPPSGKFLGANMADASFVNAYGDATLKNDRGETFQVFETTYDDGYAATSPVGMFPPIDTRRVSTTHHTYDMAGNVSVEPLM